MISDVKTDMTHLDIAESKVCETPNGCDFPATVMVWADHHKVDCNYTGFRCDIHLNLLNREVLTEMARLRKKFLEGRSLVCGHCGDEVVVGNVQDHLRWFRL